jgi:hypothetical protein
MTIKIPLKTSPSIARSATQTQPQATSSRRAYRERDFGVGYGRSSGYASQRQYANAWNGQLRFRCG